VVARLLEELPERPPTELIERARSLDAHHVPARYPNGFPEGAPFEHYGLRQSQEAVDDAGEIVGFVRAALA
jgi:HEPN domain-containing protein